MIAILAAILLPVLGRAKMRARSTACLNNTRQLAVAWTFYSSDNSEQLVYNPSMADPDTASGWVNSAIGNECLPTGATNLLALSHGLLFPYCPSLGTYQCPSALRGPSDFANVRLVRHYSLVSRLGGGPTTVDVLGTNYAIYARMYEIQDPGPAQAATFVDESVESLDDGAFCLTYDASPDIWRNSPAGRHDRGGTLAFAAAHAEHWRWRGLPEEFGYDLDTTPATMPDMLRLCEAIFHR